MSEQEILGLEDKRFAAMVARDFAWVRTPQGWKFAAWQSCPQPA